MDGRLNSRSPGLHRRNTLLSSALRENEHAAADTSQDDRRPMTPQTEAFFYELANYQRPEAGHIQPDGYMQMTAGVADVPLSQEVTTVPPQISGLDIAPNRPQLDTMGAHKSARERHIIPSYPLPEPVIPFSGAGIQGSRKAVKSATELATSACGDQVTAGATGKPASEPSTNIEIDVLQETDGPLPLHSVMPHCLVTGQWLMVIKHEEKAYTTTANVSQLLHWPSDQIMQQLGAKNITLETLVLDRRENVCLFHQMSRYGVPGIKNRKHMAESITFFLLKSVTDLLKLFDCPTKSLIKQVAKIADDYNQDSVYWQTESDDSDTNEPTSLEEEVRGLCRRRVKLCESIGCGLPTKKQMDQLNRIDERVRNVEELRAQGVMSPIRAQSSVRPQHEPFPRSSHLTSSMTPPSSGSEMLPTNGAVSGQKQSPKKTLKRELEFTSSPSQTSSVSATGLTRGSFIPSGATLTPQDPALISTGANPHYKQNEKTRRNEERSFCRLS